MRYFRISDEGLHSHDWGGDPTYWLEVNETGNAEREIDEYPNGNTLTYDRTHIADEDGALAVEVFGNDIEEFWIPHEIPKEQFEVEWNTVLPRSREG